MVNTELEAQKIVLNYCDSIAKNKIPSCIYVKKAVKRFFNDLKNEGLESWDYSMNWDIVQKFYDFTKQLKLPTGKMLHLLPWQLFIHANLIGFRYKYKPSKLRFRGGSVFVPRKNGKTFGLAIPLLIYDFLTTNSSETFLFLKDEKQSEKFFRDIRTICKNSAGLKDIIDDTGTNIYYKNSKISYFTSESMGIDGYSPSLAVIDEFWCYQSDRPVTAMKYGSRARENGLVLIITTAGNDISVPCYTEFERSIKILNGLLTDDSYFAIFYGIDDGDDWKSQSAYIKANPSIDVIIDRKILEQDLQDCLSQPSHQSDYKAKTLNLWTSEVSNWISLQKWETIIRNTEVNIQEFTGQNCYAGLDLSSVSDFTAYTKCFFREGDYYLYHKFYVPSEQIYEKYRVENINIKYWIDQGIVTAIPGATIDYDYIIEDIKKDNELYNIVELAYDKWNSTKIIEKLDEIIPKTLLIEFDQSLKKMSPNTKDFERLILEDKIVDPNPCMKWHISNTVVKPDINNNYKPLKADKSSTKRIDGVISSIMALSRCIENESNIVSRDFNTILSLF